MKLNKYVKILGILLILYSVIFGLMVPLKPGLLSVEPFNIKAGTTEEITVIGYNTHFKTAKNIDAYLKLSDKQFVKADRLDKLSETQLKASFNIPQFLTTTTDVSEAVFLINSETDGAIIKPFAVAIKQDSFNAESGKQLALNNPEPKLYSHNAFSYPYRLILEETIRNTYFHVPLWFAMIFVFAYSVWASWKYLKTKNSKYDSISVANTTVGIILGIMGLITGAVWAKYTWGEYWSGDIKQNMTAISLLIYLAYFVLRSSVDDPLKKSTLGAVYNIFAFVALIPLIFVIPRLADSLHPGNGGNPAIGGEDLDNSMRMVFYPACIGWIIISFWMADIYRRILCLEKRNMEL